MPPALLALLAGALAATGFAPLGLWPVTLLALAAFLWLVREAASLRRAALLGWLWGLAHFTVGLNWIAGAFRYQDAMPVWLGWLAVPALSLYLALFPALAAALAWRFRGDRAAYALAWSAAWIASEWLRGTLFTGFPWNPLAAAAIDTPARGLARLFGTYGLSGLVVLVAAALADARRFLAFPAALVAAALAGSFALGRDPGGSFLTVRVVQPGINQNERNDPESAARNVARLTALGGPPTGRGRLLLWPEGAVPALLEEQPLVRSQLAALLGPRDVLLTGGDAMVMTGGAVTAARNSVFALDARGTVLARYDKAHLVPYGEYLPMRPLLSALGLSRLVPGDLDFAPGPGPRTLALPGFGLVGVQLCYEIVFSGAVLDRAARPAFLFNPSNDAWFGAWGPPQHLAQARLRAVEEGVPVVRATPTGISAVIDARGSIRASVPLGRAGFLETDLPRAAPPTPFARAGNLLPLGVALLLALAAVALLRARR